MSITIEPCHYCGEKRETYSFSVLGTEHVMPGPCRCQRERNEMQRQRHLAAFDRIVREMSSVSLKFEDATVRDHPNESARQAGTRYMAKMPSPRTELVAVSHDWSTCTPDDKLRLASAQRRVMRGKPGLGIYGLRGRGKTGLAYAILRAMRLRGVSGIGVNVRILLDDCKNRYRDKSRGTVDALFAPLRNTPILLLDDIDKSFSDSEDELLKLYAIAEARIEVSLPTIVTANRGPIELERQFTEKFGENGGAVIDRFVDNTAGWVELSAEHSYRMESR